MLLKTEQQEIEILDYETNVEVHAKNVYNDKTCRWTYVFPWWINFGIGEEEMAHPIRCDFSDVCKWAYDRKIIEDFCIEVKEGQVTIPGNMEVTWSEEKQDAVETFAGRYLMNFSDFLREYLTEKDLQNFVKFVILEKKFVSLPCEL